VLLLVGLAAPVQAQPPEYFRLDLSLTGLLYRDSRGFLEGSFAPTTSSTSQAEEFVAVGLLDVTGTLNVTSRLSLSAGIPFGVVSITPLDEEDGEQVDGGQGDVHLGVSYELLDEQPWLPGVTLRLEGGAPTATNPFLGTDLWRVTAGGRLAKSLGSRVALFVDGSYSHYFDRAGMESSPVVSYGGGMNFGVSPTTVLTLKLEEVSGGERRENGRVVASSISDLRAELGATFFSKGRPRVSFLLGAGRLQATPTFLFSVKFAALSF